MRQLGWVLFLALLTFASTSYAGPIRNYLGVSAGLLLPDTSTVTDATGAKAELSYDSGTAFSGLIGHEFGMGLRVESEIDYKRANLDKFRYAGTLAKASGDFWSLGMLVSAYYDFFRYSGFSPYLGAGIGFADVNMSSSVASGATLWNSDRDIAIAYQAGFGFNLWLRRNLSVDLGYRYYGTNDYKIDQVTSGFSSHSMQVGLKYYLP